MLAANRDQLVAQMARSSQDLRRTELDNLISNYQSIMSVTTLAAGFAFASMVEMEHDTLPVEEDWMVRNWIDAFYILTSLALVLALFVVASSTIAVIAGQRLGLKGGRADSLTRAVCVLIKEFRWVALAGSLAMLCIVGAAVCIVALKTNELKIEFATMAIFGVGTCVIFSHACRLGSKLSIDEGDVVGGDVRVRGGGQVVDLTTIQPETCSDYQPPVIPGAATAPSANVAARQHRGASINAGIRSAAAPSVSGEC